MIRLNSGRHLGQCLRRLRHSAGISPEGLARRLTMSRSGVLRREQVGFLPADALITHANALGYGVALVRPADWPTTGHPVDPDAVHRVLAQFDAAHPTAVAQLADVALVPARHPGARPTGTGWPT